jgi:hypothetical protein
MEKGSQRECETKAEWERKENAAVATPEVDHRRLPAAKAKVLR